VATGLSFVPKLVGESIFGCESWTPERTNDGGSGFTVYDLGFKVSGTALKGLGFRI